MRMIRRLVALAAAFSLALCAIVFVVWVLGVGPWLNERHGTSDVYVWNGKLCVGSVFRDGASDDDLPRFAEGWSIRVASWKRLRSASGRVWTATKIELWCIGLVIGLPAGLRYRPLKRLYRHTQRKRRARRGLCPNCGYSLCGASDRCPECGSPKVEVLKVLIGAPVSESVTGPAAVGSLVICAAAALLWLLSFDAVRVDPHGVRQIFLADGKFWLGPPFPGGETPIRTQGWNIGIASWSRSEGVWGARWTSFSVDLLAVAVTAAIPAAIRYRPRKNKKGHYKKCH